VKVLFFMPGPGYLRHYESALRLLARRGVNVHLAFDGNEPDVDTGQKLRDDLVREFANVTFEAVPEIKLGAWGFLAKAARLFQDYLRYSNPVFDKAPILKDRMWGKTPPTLLAVFEFLARKCRLGARILGPALRLLDWMVPVDRRITAWIAEKSPDLVLITPLVYFGSAQVDYVKVARRLGVRSALCVASWDNLTNKGLIRIMPDKIFVWNDAQKSEAVTLHGARADCVETTGAQTFDEWFVARPKLSREYFFRTVGLDPVHPYLLYLCSSKSIAPNEVMFIEKWIHALRSSAFPELRKAGILVRPHPKNLEQWTYPDVLQAENVAVWPRTITDWVIDDEKRADYFHSLYFSRAVVGVNTSALIEAGIVGRAVYTVLAPEFSRTQQGTLHFHYLKDFSGGLLRVARNFDEHRAGSLRNVHADLREAPWPRCSGRGRPGGQDRVVGLRNQAQAVDPGGLASRNREDPALSRRVFRAHADAESRETGPDRVHRRFVARRAVPADVGLDLGARAAIPGFRDVLARVGAAHPSKAGHGA
jgi:hypothetical protein